MSAFDDFKKLFKTAEEPKPPETIDDVVKKYSDNREMKTVSNIKMNSLGQVTGNITNTTAPNYNYTVASGAVGYTTVTSAMTGTGYYGGVNMGGVTMQAPAISPHVVKFNSNITGKEIVRITNEGKVIWDDEIEIDEAAEAFSKSISMGVELKAGITEKVKREMRDSVFEDIIEIAKQKGSLNAEDLTYLLQAAKIMEKLKGGK